MTPDAREQVRHIIETVQGYRDGKEIERSRKLLNQWHATDEPDWDWLNYDFRVKPEERKPITLDLWIMPNTPDVYYEKSFFPDRKSMEEKGWSLKRFVEAPPGNRDGVKI